MSHHLDTPLAAQTGQLFIDDLYVFPGQGSTVFVMDGAMLETCGSAGKGCTFPVTEWSLKQ